MADARPTRLDRPVDLVNDHILGSPQAAITLVEYGSYACPFCHAAHEVIADLRDRFGDRMRYVFRHRPIGGSDDAQRSAALAEYAYATTGEFWPVHDALMKRGPVFNDRDFTEIAEQFNLPPAYDDAHAAALHAAEDKVQADAESARNSGALVTPTFFINGRRYEGAWDETALAEAMLGSLGHRLHSATLDFVRWAPSTGLLLLLMSVLAVALVNSSAGPAFQALWHAPTGFHFGDSEFVLPLIDWVNHGLLTLFFVVVGLEIKREFTVGRLATRRAAALPIAAALGGMLMPALIYLSFAPTALSHGWGITIATDTAFAVALIVLLGERVPVELRVFLTAAVIVDDLVAIAVVALFYSDALHFGYLAAAMGVTVGLVLLNRSGVQRALPYTVLGVMLWFLVHEGGLHATLAGVILAVIIPTRPPPNLHVLMAQAQTVIEAETKATNTRVLRHGPSEPALQALDAIHSRIESPANKVLRSLEPWSSYAVLPLFALANAGVVLSADVIEEHTRLVLAVVLGLVVGKPTGIVLAAWLAVRVGVATKSAAYTWRQLAGAGALAGIGFTMSLFIAGQAFPNPDDFAATKIAIFIASIIAGTAGLIILSPRAKTVEVPVASVPSRADTFDQ